MTTSIAEGSGPPWNPTVAYFSMEIAIDDSLPTYCGGLGVLAGDHLRALADLGVPTVAVTLLYRGGYFTQSVDGAGHQHEQPVRWVPEARLEELRPRVAVELDGTSVHIRAWRHWITGCTGSRVAVLFLDTDVVENAPSHRAISDQIYAGDEAHRLRQEAVLGIGGVRMLARLGWAEVPTFHMNEGHSSLLTVALLDETSGPLLDHPDRAAAVRDRCVFTTHTPVPEGHDQFDRPMVEAVLGQRLQKELVDLQQFSDDDKLNMTVLGMSFSRSINAVSLLHGEVSRAMFPRFSISSITNGVHAGRWVSPSFADLFDRFVPTWRRDNAALRETIAIPLDAIEAAHRQAKQALVELVAGQTKADLDPDALTLGIARRAAAYKRLDLLLSRPDALVSLTRSAGPLQIVYSGKAHPADEKGKRMIGKIHEAAARLGDAVPVVYLEDYSLELAAVICAGSDVWVNTPIWGHEASGTSGMKAALNGVPSLSVLDGWWPEGHVEGVTGWAVGNGTDQGADADAASLCALLGDVVAPLYYGAPEEFLEIRRSTIALTGSYFTAERMARQYVTRAYRADPPD